MVMAVTWKPARSTRHGLKLIDSIAGLVGWLVGCQWLVGRLVGWMDGIGDSSNAKGELCNHSDGVVIGDW